VPLRRRALLAALPLALAGCAGGLLGDLVAPEVAIAGLGFGAPGLFEQEVLVNLRLTNPNDFALAVRGLSFDLALDDRPFASGRTGEAFTMPRLGSVTVPVAILVPTAELVDRVMGLGRREGYAYRLTGQLRLDRLAGVPLPFSREGRLALPRLPGLGGFGS
jgi:LEA14-like dessication related protein